MKDPYAGNTAEDPHAGVEWSRGMLDMAEAIQENRQQRITGAQAAHVIDIVCGIQAAFREGRRVEMTSEFPQPAPMELTSRGILKPLQGRGPWRGFRGTLSGGQCEGAP